MKVPTEDKPWHLFEVDVADLLRFYEKRSGHPLPDAPSPGSELNRWHHALRRGLKSRLHVNLGGSGWKSFPQPIFENTCALHAALLLGHKRLRVILNGEWSLAVKECLIKRDQLEKHEAILKAHILEEKGGSNTP
jgi:hypothetical protein